MHKLNVIYQGWGERWLLGTLLDTGRDLLFEYSALAIERGLQLSPLHQPLPLTGAAPLAFRGLSAFMNLPGFIADALPDGWGLLLMDRALRRAGRDPQRISVLERLAIVGDRAMGALSFEPAEDGALPQEALQLQDLAEEVVRLQAADVGADQTAQSDEKLRQLLRLGGSPQGARPKVLVNFDPTNALVSSGVLYAQGTSPWLFKFPAANEHPEVAAMEQLYAKVARHGGMDMPTSRFVELGKHHSAFGVERFDRLLPPLAATTVAKQSGSDCWRVPVLSLSALLQADHRLPSLDYETVLLATQRITGDRREVVKAFDRCVVNVLLHNRDDHSRNFAYRMDRQGLWKLSPAFDVTCSQGPGGEHATSVAGQGKAITREHLLKVAKSGGLEVRQANNCIDHWLGVVRGLADHVGDLPIRQSTLQTLMQTTTGLCDAVARDIRRS